MNQDLHDVSVSGKLQGVSTDRTALSKRPRDTASHPISPESSDINPLALELDIYSLAHHLCKMLIFYEPRMVTLGNTRHFVEE